VLFGCGNVGLLDGRAVAVVGSRNASEADLSYATRIGALTARAGAAVVSGAARGIDEAAMLGALDAEGTAVGVLADGLLRASSSLARLRTNPSIRSYDVAPNSFVIADFRGTRAAEAGRIVAGSKRSNSASPVR